MLFSERTSSLPAPTGDLGVAYRPALISQGANVLAVAGTSEISRLATFSGPGSSKQVSQTSPTPNRCLATPHAAFALWGKSTASSTCRIQTPVRPDSRLSREGSIG